MKNINKNTLLLLVGMLLAGSPCFGMENENVEKSSLLSDSEKELINKYVDYNVDLFKNHDDKEVFDGARLEDYEVGENENGFLAKEYMQQSFLKRHGVTGTFELIKNVCSVELGKKHYFSIKSVVRFEKKRKKKKKKNVQENSLDEEWVLIDQPTKLTSKEMGKLNRIFIDVVEYLKKVLVLEVRVNLGEEGRAEAIRQYLQNIGSADGIIVSELKWCDTQEKFYVLVSLKIRSEFIRELDECKKFNFDLGNCNKKRAYELKAFFEKVARDSGYTVEIELSSDWQGFYLSVSYRKNIEMFEIKK